MLLEAGIEAVSYTHLDVYKRQASPYAEGVDFEEAVDSAIELARLSELDDLD